MSRESSVFVLGLLVFLIPFLGFLRDWEKIILIVSGVLLMIFGYSLRRSTFLRSIDDGEGQLKSEAFAESTQTKLSETGTIDDQQT